MTDGLPLTIVTRWCHNHHPSRPSLVSVHLQLSPPNTNNSGRPIKLTNMRCWYQSLHRCQSPTFDMASSKSLELIHHLVSIIFQPSAHGMHMIICFLSFRSWEMTTNNKLDADAELRHVVIWRVFGYEESTYVLDEECIWVLPLVLCYGTSTIIVP